MFLMKFSDFRYANKLIEALDLKGKEEKELERTLVMPLLLNM